MKYDSKKIIAAIQAAIAEADAVDAFHGDEDGGTCNMDSAYLSVPGMRQKQAEEIMAAFPRYKVVFENYQFHGRILMLLHNRGQANRRSRMCEAAYRSFKASGLAAGQYLQMD